MIFHLDNAGKLKFLNILCKPKTSYKEKVTCTHIIDKSMYTWVYNIFYFFRILVLFLVKNQTKSFLKVIT